jgi:uncharacterized membrane protein
MDQYYLPVRDIHSYLRWLIIGLAVITVVKYLLGWIGKRKFTSVDNRLSLFFITSLDIQLLLGLVLYFFLSPITQSAIQFGGYQLEDPNVRFYAIEHPVIMVLAIVFAHVGRVVVKRTDSDRLKYKRGTILFAISLILMLSRMQW